MLTPAYKLTIGNKVIDTTDNPQASTVVDLKVSLDMETSADSVTVLLGRVGKFKPQRDDAIKVELGYADEKNSLTQVVSGTIAEADPTLVHTRLVAYSPAVLLLRTFVDHTYEKTTAAEIVKDLCKKSGVDVATADDGITFPAYVVDGRRSAYHHLEDLAALCGVDVYVNADGKLVFEKFLGGKTVHVLEFAKHILDLQVRQTTASAGQVQAWGESPGAGKGDEAWAWLTKDFGGLKGTSGSATPTALLERSVLRTAAAAATAAQAEFTRVSRRALRGRVVTWGSPQIKLGDAVHLSNVPDNPADTPVQVRSVTHRIDKRRGFMSSIEFRSAS
jgi:phage protein D